MNRSCFISAFTASLFTLMTACHRATPIDAAPSRGAEKKPGDALCVLYSDMDGCAPNIHRLFASFHEYEGKKVFLQAFARLGPRRELHIYPSNDAACRPVFGGAILVNPASKVPEQLLSSLWKNGVARVSVGGTASTRRVPMMWGEIGSLEGGSVALIEDSVVYFHSEERLLGPVSDSTDGVTLIPPVRCLD